MAAFRSLLLFAFIALNLDISCRVQSTESSERHPTLSRSIRDVGNSSDLDGNSSNVLDQVSALPQKRAESSLSVILKLKETQCAKVDQVFRKSGLSSVTYLESCKARFIHINHLYDGNLLVYISLEDWAISESRLEIFISKVHEQIRFNYGTAALVVRVDDCKTKNPISVTVKPPPDESIGGLVKVNVSNHHTGIGELLLDRHQLPDKIELQMVSPSHQCSLAKTYLMLCARNQHSSCPIRLGSRSTTTVECDCGAISSWSYVTFYAFCAILVLILGGLSYSELIAPEPECGLDEDSLSILVSDRRKAYYYQAIYRVGCPTIKFDARNTLIDFELLGPRLEPIGGQVRFMLTDLTGTKLSIFICNIFTATPLPAIGGVRVSHTRGFPGSGVFLFDVLLKFLDEPERPMDKPDSKANSPDPSKIKNQRVKIFAYILDSSKIYTKLKGSDPIQLPPFIYPKISQIFLKVLIWYCTVQTVCLATLMIEYTFLKLQMIILSVCIALMISILQLLQLAILVLIHKWFALQLSKFELLYGIEPRKSSKKSPKTSSYDASNHGFLYYLNYVFVILLLLATGFFVGLIIWHHKQSFVHSLYIESVFVIVLVVVVGTSAVVYNTFQECCFFSEDHLMSEYQLMSESNLRAQQYSTSTAGSTTSSTDNPSLSKSSPSDSTKGTGSSRRTPVSGSFEMFDDKVLL